jgi:hypothetical protein
MREAQFKDGREQRREAPLQVKLAAEAWPWRFQGSARSIAPASLVPGAVLRGGAQPVTQVASRPRARPAALGNAQWILEGTSAGLLQGCGSLLPLSRSLLVVAQHQRAACPRLKEPRRPVVIASRAHLETFILSSFPPASDHHRHFLLLPTLFSFHHFLLGQTLCFTLSGVYRRFLISTLARLHLL